MLELLVFPALLQISAAPGEFYEQEYSEATMAAIAAGDDGDASGMTEALEELGEQGDASAYEALGEIYTNGALGVARDARRGCDYFEKVGDARADSLHNLATCFYSGNGREQDLARARALYKQAAEGGWRMSYCAYGNMLVRGEGGPEDKPEGLRLCRETAILGDPDAQTDYGIYLLTGNGTERDPVAARFMLEQAGAQSQRNAAFLLGQIHSKGDGTPVNHVAASEWFTRAYDWGRPDAAFEVAKSFLRRGYVQNEDGTVTVRPDLLRQSLDWLEEVKRIEPEGSERLADAVALTSSIETMIKSAEERAAD